MSLHETHRWIFYNRCSSNTTSCVKRSGKPLKHLSGCHHASTLSCILWTETSDNAWMAPENSLPLFVDERLEMPEDIDIQWESIIKTCLHRILTELTAVGWIV
ncbi:hypothetical protein C5167_029727, partial [Papaver somniferum]